jgi:hypothetical protein
VTVANTPDGSGTYLMLRGLQYIEADHALSGSSSSTVSSRFLSLWLDFSSTLTFLKLKSLGTYQNR